MTMDESVREIEYISNKLKGNEIVTFKAISHEFNISYNNAKVILYKFFKSNKAKFKGQFIINGIINSTRIIKFINEEDLDDYLLKLDKILDIYIYSVTPKNDYSLQDFVIANLDINVSHENYKLGMIKGPNLVSANNYKSNRTEDPFKKDVKKEIKNNDKKEVNSGLKSNYVSRKKDVKRPIEPPKYQYKSRKLERQQRDKVVLSNDHDDPFDDDLMESNPLPAEPVPKKTKLSDIFNDDDDDEVNDDDTTQANEDEKKDAQPMEVDPEVESTTTDPPIDMEVEDKDVNKAPESHEPQYDEDGYLITYNKSAKTPKPKPKPVPKSTPKVKEPTKPNTKNSKPKAKGQPSVMSFFGKKK